MLGVQTTTEVPRVGEAAAVTWPAELVERYQGDYAALTRVAFLLLGRWGDVASPGGYLHRYVSDLSDDDIATTLGCRRATGRSLVARGLATIRTEVSDGT